MAVFTKKLQNISNDKAFFFHCSGARVHEVRIKAKKMSKIGFTVEPKTLKIQKVYV